MVLVCRAMSDLESQGLPSMADVRAAGDGRGTAASSASAASSSTAASAAAGLSGGRGEGGLFATMSAPPVVDRTVAHPNHTSQAKAVVQSTEKGETPESANHERCAANHDHCTRTLAVKFMDQV